MRKRNIALIIAVMILFLTVLSISYSAQTANGTNANLSTWDNTSQFGEIDDNIEFYANYTNSSGLLPNATCNITFFDGTQTMNESAIYQYNRSFSAYGNKTYSINCTLGGFDSLNISDWIYINPKITTNITIWESAANKTEYDNTQISFYANYTNTTGAANQFVSGAACNISFSDSQSAIMTQEASSVYNYTRNFTTLGNFTYTVNCTASSLPSAQNSSWISIIETPLMAPALFWDTSTTQTHNQVIALYGYINTENILITASVQDENATLTNNSNTTSGELSSLIGTYIVLYDRAQGQNQIVINGTNISSVLTSHFIEFANHNNTNFLRYDISQVSVTGPYSRSIIINGSFSSDIPAGTVARIYDKIRPSGHFNINVTLFPNITNYVEVWGTSGYGTPGPVSNFSVYYNTTPVVLLLSGSLNDTGLTTDVENLFFDWNAATGADYYEISIGTAQYPTVGYSSVLSWARANVSNYTSSANLDIDTTYYASVRAVNGTLVSNVISSNGIIYWDTSPPTCVDCIFDQGDWTNDNTLTATWNFTENESEISYYTYEVGTQSCYEVNSSNVDGPTQTTNPFSSNVVISTPANNETYYFNVWAKNTETFRNSTSDCFSSNGIRFDNETPSGGYISYPSGRFTAPQISIDYSPGIDQYSGLAKNELWQRKTAISTFDGSCNAFGAPVLLTNLSLSNDTEIINLDNGYCYNFEIRAYDWAGNQKTYSVGGVSYNYSLDSTMPGAPTPSDTSNNGGYSTTSITLVFTWSGAQDNESGIKGYNYRLYKGNESGAYISTVVDWTYTEQTSTTLNNLGLEDSQVYFLEIYSVNNFDMSSTNAITDGLIFFDSAPPQQLTILSVHNDTTQPYIILTNESQINFSVYGEPFETCQVSLYDIDYLGYNKSKVLIEFTTNSSSNGNFSIGTGNLSQGENIVYVACKDIYGNEQTRLQNTEVNFTIDTQGPTINVVNPANGTTETGTFIMRIDVTDDYGMQSATYKIVNASNPAEIWYSGVLLEGQNNLPLDFNAVDTTADFNIIVNATDMNNKSSGLQTVFTIDNTIPDATIYNSNNYYNTDFSMNFTFELFTNYTITITQDNGTIRYSKFNSSSVQRTLVNDTVTVNVYTDWTNWPEANYTVTAAAVNMFGNLTQDTDWFIVDITQPFPQNNQRTPSTVYSDDDVEFSINFTDVYLEIVWFESNFSGSMTNYTINSSSDIYTYTINASNTSTNQGIRYRWHANDTAGNYIFTVFQSFTVQNRVPYFILPGLSFNNTKILNKEDYYQQILAYDTEGDNLTYKIQGAGQNITASLINYSDSSRNYTVVKISPDNNYVGSSWIMFNVTDSYGAINQTINFTLNITNSSVGQTINTNSTLLIDFSYWQNVSMPLIQNLIGYYPSYESSMQTAISADYNTSITNLLIEPNQTSPRIIIENLNLSKYPTLNVSYQPYNLSLFNNTLFLGGLYTVYDAFIFEIDNNTYNGTYTVFWNYPDFNITDYIASNFLYIYKLDINSSTLNITYNTSTLASSITVNSSFGYIWGTYSEFSLFVLAEITPTSEGSTCDSIDNDHDGQIDEGINCNPGGGGGGSSGSSGGSSGSSSLSSGFSGSSSLGKCSNGVLDSGEDGADCGGVCLGHWYNNQCNLLPESAGTCSDGVQNQDETDVDCGGVCTACIDTQQPSQAGTCFDGIQNQNEYGIDCGGTCPSCPSCFDGVQNQGEEDVDCGEPCLKKCKTKYIPMITGLVKENLNYVLFGLGALTILGAALGFVLAKKHGHEHEYKTPTAAQTPQQLMQQPLQAAQEGLGIGQTKGEAQPIPVVEDMVKIEPEPIKEKLADQTDFENLVAYVDSQQSKGTFNSTIRTSLLKSGWPQELIDEAFERAECSKRLNELDRFVKNAKAQGHTDKLIKASLLKADWAEHFIEMVLHDVHRLHNDFEKVKKYAKTLFLKGYSKQDIQKTLTDVGWSKKDIDPFLAEED